MRKIAWRLLPLLGAAAAVLGLALGSAPASASTAAHAIVASNVGTHYSPDLAGFSSAGNGSTIIDGAWRNLVVPAEPSTIPADTVVDGIIMGQNLSAGVAAAGEGLVLNDPASSCAPVNGVGTWTLEAGQGSISLSGQPVLPASDLSPIKFFGSDVCWVGAGSEFAYIYDTHKYHDVDFSGGPSSNNWDVLSTQHADAFYYRTAGGGILTCSTGDSPCSGTNAANDLTQGSMFDGTGLAFYVNGQGNSVFGQGKNLLYLNYINWVGTQDGGAPTTGNLVTLNTNPLTMLSGPYGVYTENVPVIAGPRA